MSDNGWPDKPGVPLSPKRDGWHWIERYPRVPSCFWWCAGWHANGASGWGRFNEQDRLGKWRYLGPCLTPAEVAAREAAAFQRGAEAMREKCKDEAFLSAYGGKSPLGIAAAIRALPVPEDKP